MRRNNIAKRNNADAQTKRFGYSMITPTIIVLLVMTAYPLIFTLFYSFTDYNLLRNLREPASFIAVSYTHLDVYKRQA